MLARHTKMMQLLLFYCIVVQCCVLRDVESILTPTESSEEWEISAETVERSDDDSETTTEFSFFGSVIKIFKSVTSIMSNIPSVGCMREAINFLKYVKRGKRDTTNKQSVADIELNPNEYDRILRAIDKRDRRQLKKAIQQTINFLDDLSEASAIPLLIPAKIDSKDDLYTRPKEKRSVAFENDESIRNKRFRPLFP